MTNMYWLMLFREIISIRSENLTKLNGHRQTLYVNDNAGGTHACMLLSMAVGNLKVWRCRAVQRRNIYVTFRANPSNGSSTEMRLHAYHGDFIRIFFCLGADVA